MTGSGRKGRITKEDVQSLADGKGGGGAAAPADGGGGWWRRRGGLDLLPWPSVDFEKFGPVERVERSRIQRISAPNLARNWVMIPHVTHNDEADITELEAWRKQLNEEHSREGVKFTMVSFLVAACVAALKEFPNFNSSLDGDELVLKRYYNIGFAADTPGGLRGAGDQGRRSQGPQGDRRRAHRTVGRAREGKLSVDEMRGATFTISSLGGIGGTSFTPIINAPEVAILGVTRAAMKPVWNGSEFVPAADGAAVAVLRPPRDRRRRRREVRGVPRRRAVGSAPGAAVSEASEVRVPDIGDFDDVPVIEILVSVGDEVTVEDPLVTLESDKATMDVPAPLAGVVKQLSVSVGDRVSEGSCC